MFFERDITVCFSGHRGYSGEAESGAEGRLMEALEAAYGAGYRVFISGMASGFDLFAAEAVLRLRSQRPDIKLVAAVPFAGQARDYSAGDKRRYDALLAAADVVEILSEGYFQGCYLRRNDWMVGRASRLICWFDGSSGRSSGSGRTGGTRYTVRRAVAGGLAVVNVFRSEGELF